MVTQLRTSTEFFDLMRDVYLGSPKYRTTTTDGRICYVYFDPNLTSTEKTNMKNTLVDRLFLMTDMATIPQDTS